MFHENEIIGALSHPLQSQVALLKCHNVLTALRVLHDENLARTIAMHLERVVFIDEDYVIRMVREGAGFERGPHPPSHSAAAAAADGGLCMPCPTAADRVSWVEACTSSARAWSRSSSKARPPP